MIQNNTPFSSSSFIPNTPRFTHGKKIAAFIEKRWTQQDLPLPHKELSNTHSIWINSATVALGICGKELIKGVPSKYTFPLSFWLASLALQADSAVQVAQEEQNAPLALTAQGVRSVLLTTLIGLGEKVTDYRLDNLITSLSSLALNTQDLKVAAIALGTLGLFFFELYKERLL